MPDKKEEKRERKTRSYHSPRRQEQAIVTRERIISAAIHQLNEAGYADMTLESIAKEAGVAQQTVYAVCGSKKGVLAAILEHFVAEHNFVGHRDQIPTIKNGMDRIRAMATFHTLLMENNAPNFQIMRGMGVVSPELAEMEKDGEMMVYEKSMKTLVSMKEDGLLRDDIPIEKLCDMYWSLNTPGMYRRLTHLQGWSREEVADFLAEIWGNILLKPDLAKE